MRPTKVALLSLVLLPAVALAQRGGGGSSRTRGEKSADWNSVENANKGAVKLSNRDLENISPIKLLIDKKKDLKLSDDQVNKLKELDGKLKERTTRPSRSSIRFVGPRSRRFDRATRATRSAIA